MIRIQQITALTSTPTYTSILFTVLSLPNIAHGHSYLWCTNTIDKNGTCSGWPRNFKSRIDHTLQDTQALDGHYAYATTTIHPLGGQNACSNLQVSDRIEF